jgi:hypothetical protein
MGWTPTHWACKLGFPKLTQLFLEDGANAEAADLNGRTALFMASQSGHVEVLQVLLSHGADVNHKDQYGSTALFVAVINGHEAAVDCLLDVEGIVVDDEDSFGRGIHWRALRSGNTHVLRAVLRFTQEECISMGGHEPTVGPLLVSGARRYCDVCYWLFPLDPTPYYRCSTCNGALCGFDICLHCFDVGARCRDESHKLEKFLPSVSEEENNRIE